MNVKFYLSTFKYRLLQEILKLGRSISTLMIMENIDQEFIYCTMESITMHASEEMEKVYFAVTIKMKYIMK